MPLYNRELEASPPDRLRAYQLARLNELLRQILPSNRFYARKLGAIAAPIEWDTFHGWPFTTKTELVGDQETHPPLGTIATYAREQYVVYHQTSGTTGRP
jgi:phenylacetate-CoA ligase